VLEHMKATVEGRGTVEGNMRVLKEKEMQYFHSCFKNDRQDVVTQIKDVDPSIDYKPIEIHKVNININSSITILSAEDIDHTVDQVVNASSTNRLQKTNRW
jgi:hypothetical protein